MAAFFRASTTASTALSMPRFSSIGLAPAATFFNPSRTIAEARTVAVVVPSPAASLVLLATSLTRRAPRRGARSRRTATALPALLWPSYGWSRESVVSTPGSRVLVSSPNSGGRSRRNQQFSGGRHGRFRGRQGSVSPDFVDSLALAGDYAAHRRGGRRAASKCGGDQPMRTWQVSLTIILLVTGFLAVAQWRAGQPLRAQVELPTQRVQQLAVLLKQQEEARLALEAEI